ncbi:hypothetical protein CHCC16874_0534 [Bacillus licheniformis]|nr:hypothetical protein CHCC16874_0534 [Bacillus licheniformis]
MKFKIETLPNYRIAYMRRVGPYGPANIEVMERLKKWAKKKDLLESAILFATRKQRLLIIVDLMLVL